MTVVFSSTSSSAAKTIRFRDLRIAQRCGAGALGPCAVPASKLLWRNSSARRPSAGPDYFGNRSWVIASINVSPRGPPFERQSLRFQATAPPLTDHISEAASLLTSVRGKSPLKFRQASSDCLHRRQEPNACELLRPSSRSSRSNCGMK